MGHGGKREGAGRKPGARNSRTTEIIEAMVANGELTPLEFLKSVYQDVGEDMARRVDAAKAAAPYCHPKRVPVDSQGDDSNGLTVIVQKP